ncbi:hypothetical protein [Geminisphaera colitermitum]|uniref:hypothetical protein n=1 Tax=Geminisphaera colitermitum TaxID=1148786 RepID=UPI0012FF2D31|nr:hypothetical protein [Geminisphaera colitermitum]
MSTATLRKPIRAKSKLQQRKHPVHRLKLDLSKPIQGQGIGTATTTADYDPSAPAYSADEWGLADK